MCPTHMHCVEIDYCKSKKRDNLLQICYIPQAFPLYILDRDICQRARSSRCQPGWTNGSEPKNNVTGTTFPGAGVCEFLHAPHCVLTG